MSMLGNLVGQTEVNRVLTTLLVVTYGQLFVGDAQGFLIRKDKLILRNGIISLS